MSDGTPIAGSSVAGRRRFELAELAPIATLAALVAFFCAVSPSFRQVGTALLVLEQGAPLAIVAAGLTFVLICGEIDLAVGNIAVWAACLCAWLLQTPFASAYDPVPIWLTALVLVLPLASCLALGIVSGVLTVWSRLPSFIITLAMMNVAMGQAKYLTENQTMKVPGILSTIGNDGLLLGGRHSIAFSVFIAAAVMAAGHVVLQHTRLGRHLYMTGGNREAARLAGVRTSLVVVASLGICAVAAGLGGLINAGRLQSASVLLNPDLLLKAVACVVLGGTSLFGGEGGMGRTVIGVATLCTLDVGLNRVDWIPEDARLLLMGVVLMAALVVNGSLAKRQR